MSKSCAEFSGAKEELKNESKRAALAKYSEEIEVQTSFVFVPYDARFIGTGPKYVYGPNSTDWDQFE